MPNLVYLALNASYAHTMLAGWLLKASLTPGPRSVQWRTVEATSGDDPRALLGRILDFRPDVLAVSVYLFNVPSVYPLLRRVKICRPDCVIIAGGPEFSGGNEAILRREPALDAVVRGEGENALAQFVPVFQERSAWRDIPGLCFISNGVYCDGGWADPIQPLDRIPSPYADELTGFQKPFIQLETSRGCSNSCAFCTSGTRPGVRFYREERIRADLETIRRHGIRQVRLVDRTFNEPPKRAVELLTLFRRDFAELAFHLEIDPARVTPEFVEALQAFEPGQLLLEVGIQTFRAETLDTLGRRGTVADMRRGLTLLSAVKTVDLHVDLVAGLPGVDWDQLIRDLNELTRLGPREIQLEILKVLPGTELERRREEWGIRAAGDPPYEVLQTRELTPSNLLQAHRLSRAIDWFYNVEAFRPWVCQAVIREESFWPRWLMYLEGEGVVSHCPSLENRYRLLDAYWGRKGDNDLRQALQYDWLKRGHSPQKGIAPGEPWKSGLPADAVLCEGTPPEKVHRIVRAVWDRDYFFVYASGEGPDRPAAAVYCCGPRISPFTSAVQNGRIRGQ
jgi:radical SAM superfamily enzyme YgiQ (UPF0313 family)